MSEDNGFFTRLMLKLLALVLAVILWLYVRGELHQML
jgi:hypothetical protein